MLRFKRKRYTNLTAQSFIVLVFTYLTIVISDTFAGRSWRRNATNYWRKKKGKRQKQHSAFALPLFPARRGAPSRGLSLSRCRDVHVRAVRSGTDPRASTCVVPFIFNLRFKSCRAAYSRRARRCCTGKYRFWKAPNNGAYFLFSMAIVPAADSN